MKESNTDKLTVKALFCSILCDLHKKKLFSLLTIELLVFAIKFKLNKKLFQSFVSSGC